MATAEDRAMKITAIYWIWILTICANEACVSGKNYAYASDLEIETRDGQPWLRDDLPRQPRFVFRSLHDKAEVTLECFGSDGILQRHDLARSVDRAHAPTVDGKLHNGTAVFQQDSFLEPGSACELFVDGDSVRSFEVAKKGGGAALVASWPVLSRGWVYHSEEAFILRFDDDVARVTLMATQHGESFSLTPNLEACGRLGWAKNRCAAFDNTLERDWAELIVGGATPGGISLVPRTYELFLSPGAPTVPQKTRCRSYESRFGLACLALFEDGARVRFLFDTPTYGNIASGDRERPLLQFVANAGEHTYVVDLHEDRGALTLTFNVGAQVVQATKSYRLPNLPQITITGVGANPKGDEKTLEYVEIENLSGDFVPLYGYKIATKKLTSYVRLPDAHVPPFSKIVLVSEAAPLTAFVTEVGRVSLSKRLTSGGLTNAGEAIVLLDDRKRILSAVPAIKTGENECLVRKGHLRAGRRVDFMVTKGDRCSWRLP